MSNISLGKEPNITDIPLTVKKEPKNDVVTIPASFCQTNPSQQLIIARLFQDSYNKTPAKKPLMPDTAA